MEFPIKYCRGQVWYRDDGVVNKYDSQDNIQHGRRPVVIFSSDKGNASSSFVNVIPLSCKDKPNIPINVEVMSDKGLTQVALCNMLTPCDKSELKRYEYTVTDRVMSNIERGVMIANSLDKYIKNLDTQVTFDRLKDVIEGIVQTRVNEILKDKKAQETTITTDNINSMVDRLLGETDINTPEKHVKTVTTIIPNKNNKSVSDNSNVTFENAAMRDALRNIKIDDKSDSQTDLKSNKKKSSRGKWTIDVCKDFIHDKEVLPASEMVTKYNLKDVKQVCQYYYYCKNKINKYEDDTK